MAGTRRMFRLLPLVVATSCIKTIPPTPAPERAPVPIKASFDATWNAVVEVFAAEHIPIQTLDKPSGLIVVTPDTVDSKSADRWASCGAIKHGIEPAMVIHATDVDYNIVVRAAGAGSTIRFNVRWTSHNEADPNRPDYVLCTTTNAWEIELEQKIRALAEGTSGKP